MYLLFTDSVYFYSNANQTWMGYLRSISTDNSSTFITATYDLFVFLMHRLVEIVGLKIDVGTSQRQHAVSLHRHHSIDVLQHALDQ